MGKHKFGLSHMIPNAWFYRLRDMNTARATITSAHNKLKKPLPSANYSSFCHTPKLHQSKPNYTINPNPPSPDSPLPATPIFHQQLFLSPFSTHSPSSNTQTSISFKFVEENISNNKNEIPGRRRVSGVKIRSKKSSKTAECKRDQKKPSAISTSCCIVKSTFEPQKDLKESMVEMIVENNIRGSKDLEKLLACYLSLNSSEYHDMIVKTFEEIWLTFDFGV